MPGMGLASSQACISIVASRLYWLLQVACESASKTDMVMIFGEITTTAKVDYEKVVRDTCREIGFTSNDVGLDCNTCKVSLAPLRHSAAGQAERLAEPVSD